MQAALAVVMAASGYPGSYAKGSIIRNLKAVRGAKVRATILDHHMHMNVWIDRQAEDAKLIGRRNGSAGLSRRNEHK